jgi:hypothetical protein
MSIEHLAPTLKHVGPVGALKARLEAATAWRRSVGAVDGFDGSWCVLDKRALEAKIEAAIALGRQPRQQPPHLYVMPTSGPGQGGNATRVERRCDAP